MHRLMLPLLLACCAAGHAAEPPVAHYGQEATGDDANAPGGQLREQVIMRAVADYLGEHPEEWMPSETDVEAALPAFRQSVACLPYPPAASMDDPETGRFIVAGLIAGNSAQRFLHRNFGGGRLLFQQADTEAFDATHKLAQKLEAQGKFSFATPELRAQAHAYWTRDHGASLSTPANEKAAFDPKALFITCEQAPQR